MQEAARPTAGEVERALAEVFARPEFSPREPSLLARSLSRALQWIADLLPRPTLSEGNARLVWWIVIAIILVATAALALRLARGLARWWRARERSKVVGVAGGLVAVKPAADWEAAADTAAAEGRWREAVLALYQALLLRLDTAGALRYDPAKTPGDYRREVRRDQRARGALNAFLGPFEPIAFGARPADAAAFERLRTTAAGAGTDGRMDGGADG